MKERVSIMYGDIAVGAKENCTITISDPLFSANSYKEQLKKNNMKLYNYANPCEKYQTVLDGNAVPLTSGETDNIGYWSEIISDENGNLDAPIRMILKSDYSYTSPGFTLTFDKFNNIYPTSLAITWYNNSQVLDNKIFKPDSAEYFCENYVSDFNRVRISFSKLNMPYHRLKISRLEYGQGKTFDSNSIKNISVSQAVNPLSSDIQIGTCDISLISDEENKFQEKQPITISFNGSTKFNMFVKNAKRTSKTTYELSAEDYFGIMEDTRFAGLLSTDEETKTAGEILEMIFNTCAVPYEIDEKLYEEVLYGNIPYTNCRTALMQVCFAAGAFATLTADNNTISVYVRYSNDEVKDVIPLERIKSGQSIDYGDKITDVYLSYHLYEKSNTLEELYNASQTGYGDDILVEFSEPTELLEITEGEIKESNTNYAIINAYNESCVLSGYPYTHTTLTKTKSNPNKFYGNIRNEVSITDATLISTHNVDKILERCYNLLNEVNCVNSEIIEGEYVVRTEKPYVYGEVVYGEAIYGGFDVIRDTYEYPTIELGNNYTVKTEYAGDITGTLVSQSYSLNGGIIVKDTEVQFGENDI